MKNAKNEHASQNCKMARLAIQDTLDVVGGKWKLPLIALLRKEPLRFNQLSRLAGISPRILSKELKDLEMNGLVKRKICDTRPVTVEYSLTRYSESLMEVIRTMHNWGLSHRKRVLRSG